MITRIKDLLPKIQQDHSDVPPKLIEEIINQYFKIASEQVKNPTRNELAFPWTTLNLSYKMIDRDIHILKKVIKNPKDRDEETMENIVRKKEWLEDLWEVYQNTPGFKSSKSLESYKKIPKTNPIQTKHVQKGKKI